MKKITSLSSDQNTFLAATATSAAALDDSCCHQDITADFSSMYNFIFPPKSPLPYSFNSLSPSSSSSSSDGLHVNLELTSDAVATDHRLNQARLVLDYQQLCDNYDVAVSLSPKSTAPPISADRVQKFIDDLENRKRIVSKCTELLTNLTNHFSSLQNSLSQKSQSLDTKFLSLSSTFSQALESLSQRESSLPDRESSAAARIESLKEAAFAELGDLKTSTPLSETLKLLSRRMDSAGLVKFIVSKRKKSIPLRAEISVALSGAVDPHRLVLEAFENFVSLKIGKTLGLTDKRWACGMLLHALFPEASWREEKGKGLEFSRSIGERAREMVEKWKAQLDVDGEGLKPGEAVMFLHMVVGFELKEMFDEEFLRKLVLKFSSRRDMAKLASVLGFGDKMGGLCSSFQFP